MDMCTRKGSFSGDWNREKCRELHKKIRVALTGTTSTLSGLHQLSSHTWHMWAVHDFLEIRRFRRIRVLKSGTSSFEVYCLLTA